SLADADKVQKALWQRVGVTYADIIATHNASTLNGYLVTHPFVIVVEIYLRSEGSKQHHKYTFLNVRPRLVKNMLWFLVGVCGVLVEFRVTVHLIE
ncbi:MAG: hypothetical protein VW684_11410, partial [Betaproteobacteria bacterium]